MRPKAYTPERQVEKYLKKRVEEKGGFTVKLNPTGAVGIPDRLCVLPSGRVVFVEVKRTKGGIIAPLQEWWRRRILGLGCSHAYVCSQQEVDALLEE
jgi:hypothetical protein